jgi:hypothetical protein
MRHEGTIGGDIRQNLWRQKKFRAFAGTLRY